MILATEIVSSAQAAQTGSSASSAALQPPVVTLPPQARPRPRLVSMPQPPSIFSPQSQPGVVLTYAVVDASMLGPCSEVCQCQSCGHVGFTHLKLVPTVATQLSLFDLHPEPFRLSN